MPPPELLLDLVGALYRAAEDPGSWQAFLEMFVEATRSTVGALVWQDRASGQADLSANVGVDPFLQRLYEEHYAAANVLINRGQHIWRPGAVANNQMIMTDHELALSEYANDYLRRLGVFHIHGGVISSDESVFSYLTAARPKSAGPFEEDELSLMRTLMPHLQTALRLHRHIAGLEAMRSAAAGALDCLPVGCILVGAGGEVLFANRVAEEVTGCLDGLFIKHGQLAASAASDSRKLRGLIEKAAATGEGNGREPGGCVQISRPSLRRALTLSVTPLAAARFACGSRRPVAAVFISDPEAEVSGLEDTARQLFGLSAAEARVLALLARGRSLREAADELHVSFNTVRTHLSRIMSKTQTNRQSELMRLLASALAIRQR